MHMHSSFVFFFYPPFFFFIFFVCDMRHTFKCQLPAAANGFLLPAVPSLYLSLSFSLGLAVYHLLVFLFSLFYFQYATHTYTTPPIPAIAAPIFVFFFSLRNLRQLQAEGGVEQGVAVGEGGAGCRI